MGIKLYGENESEFVVIDTIKWGSLTDAVGTCEHYPSIFPAFYSDSEEAINAAYWQLDNYAVVQSDPSEVAPYVVEVLLSILNEITFWLAKVRIYNFLIEVFSELPDECDNTDVRDNVISLQVACNKAVGKGVQKYLSDISDKDRNVRLNACYLLLSFPESVKNNMQMIRCALDNESDEEVQKILEELLDPENDTLVS